MFPFLYTAFAEFPIQYAIKVERFPDLLVRLLNDLAQNIISIIYNYCYESNSCSYSHHSRPRHTLWHLQQTHLSHIQSLWQSQLSSNIMETHGQRLLTLLLTNLLTKFCSHLCNSLVLLNLQWKPTAPNPEWCFCRSHFQHILFSCPSLASCINMVHDLDQRSHNSNYSIWISRSISSVRNSKF